MLEIAFRKNYCSTVIVLIQSWASQFSHNLRKWCKCDYPSSVEKVSIVPLRINLSEDSNCLGFKTLLCSYVQSSTNCNWVTELQCITRNCLVDWHNRGLSNFPLICFHYLPRARPFHIDAQSLSTNTLFLCGYMVFSLKVCAESTLWQVRYLCLWYPDVTSYRIGVEAAVVPLGLRE